MEKPTIEKQEQEDKPRDLLSLPDDLIRLCLHPGLERDDDLDEASLIAAIASCKPLARALLRTRVRGLFVDLDRRQGLLAHRMLRLLLQLLGDEEDLGEGRSLALQLRSFMTKASPGRCLASLAGMCLPFATRLFLDGLTLDSVVPTGVGALMPNLQELTVLRCSLTPAAKTTTIDLACARLRSVAISGLSAATAPAQQQLLPLATAQLRQLAKLPRFTSMELRDTSCPTLFILTLATHLTFLLLHESHRQCLPGTQTPAPAWRATLQQVSRCARLRSLQIPSSTAEELRLLGPTLQQLRALRLKDAPPERVDGDAVVELLLALPHLTNMCWESNMAPLRRWHTDAPCRWDALVFGAVTPVILARLPLHSLKRPVQWDVLEVDKGTPLRDVRAAVANVTQRCPAGLHWDASEVTPGVVFQETAQVPAVLQALRPLILTLAEISLANVTWDVALVKELGQALPPSCTRLVLMNCGLPRKAMEQLAVSLPWLRGLRFELMDLAPEDVVGLARAASRVRDSRLREVEVKRLKRFAPEGAWEAAAREVRRASGVVTLKRTLDTGRWRLVAA